MPEPVTGGCLCEAVRFEVDPPFLRANHCHCSRCRKHSGTAVCSQARVWREQFRLLRGADRIRVYGRGEGAVKAFCSECGSSLFGGTWPDGPQVSIRLGAFDGDPGIRPQFHTWVESRAAWDEITDTLPRYPGGWSRDAEPERPGPGSRPLRVTRIHTGPDGESHFEDTELPLRDRGAIGRMTDLLPASGVVFRETDPDYLLDWHNAPRRQYVVMLSGGRVELEVGDGSRRVLGPGDVLLAEDTTGRGHISRSLDPEPRQSIFITLP